MMCQSSSLFLFLASTAAALAQDVRMTWVGQSCFYLQTTNGQTVVIDPPGASVGYALPSMPADVVTISHNHGDHNNLAGVRGTPVLVDGRGIAARTPAVAAGLQFVMVPGFHDNVGGSMRGPNTIVTWTQGGIRFAHFGDYGQSSLTEAQLSDVRDLDVVMLPAGGVFTIGAEQTAALIAQLRPRIAILMHFRTALGGPTQLASLPGLAAPFPQLLYKPATVILNRTRLPSSTQVWVMEPAADAVVVNSAGFTGGSPVSGLSLASIFGNFANSATTSWTGFPLPRQLGETEVAIGNDTLPLLHVSPTQINFQVPGNLAPGQNAIDIRVGGQRVARGVITTLARAPGIFTVVDEDGRLNHGRRGAYITIYGSGQGPVDPVVADASAAPFPPLARAADPVVLLGDRPATVTFSGLSPGSPSLWQINAQISADAPVGKDIELVVRFESNVVSNVVKMTVE